MSFLCQHFLLLCHKENLRVGKGEDGPQKHTKPSFGNERVHVEAWWEVAELETQVCFVLDQPPIFCVGTS